MPSADAAGRVHTRISPMVTAWVTASDPWMTLLQPTCCNLQNRPSHTGLARCWAGVLWVKQQQHAMQQAPATPRTSPPLKTQQELGKGQKRSWQWLQLALSCGPLGAAVMAVEDPPPSPGTPAAGMNAVAGANAAGLVSRGNHVCCHHKVAVTHAHCSSTCPATAVSCPCHHTS
jgi:hypothetical protein